MYYSLYLNTSAISPDILYKLGLSLTEKIVFNDYWNCYYIFCYSKYLVFLIHILFIILLNIV